MITSRLGSGNIDLRFHLKDKTNKFYKMETVRSINTASLFVDDRPMDIYLEPEDINRIISALQTLKEDAGYKLKDKDYLDLEIPFMIDIKDGDSDFI